MRPGPDFQALNPTLFTLLKREFEQVIVHQPGIRFDGDWAYSPAYENVRWVIQTDGEYYAVTCPYCGDRFNRLWINHRWGTRDADGNKFWMLAHCFNQRCLGKYENLQDLRDRLFTAGYTSNVEIREGRKLSASELEARWPGPITSLSDLRPHHPAITYLTATRDFNTAKLSSLWDVGWCQQSELRLARERIIIPIYFDGRFRGWQARLAHDESSKFNPKYYTMPGTPKSELLYNFDRARQYRTGLVFEGVTHVWRVGFSGMATLGDSISAVQLGLLQTGFRDGSVVIVSDPDVRTREDQRVHENLKIVRDNLNRTIKGGAALIFTPDGYDAANFSRTIIRDYISAEAAEQGVKVSWDKKETPDADRLGQNTRKRLISPRRAGDAIAGS